MNTDYGADLRETVRNASSALRLMPEAAVRERPAPGKWCAAEIMGHLIDSASNNHQRFVRAMFRSDLRFDGYAQDEWWRFSVTGMRHGPSWSPYGRRLIFTSPD